MQHQEANPKRAFATLLTASLGLSALICLVQHIAKTQPGYATVLQDPAKLQQLMQDATAQMEAASTGRAGVAKMSAVTERDADGNPVTHFDMFDPIELAIKLGFFGALLLGPLR